jgi:hypothetical protein
MNMKTNTILVIFVRIRSVFIPSDALHRNPGVVLNGQGPGRHLLSGASYRDPGPMKNEQGSDRRNLSDALHLRPGVVKNEQGSSHFPRRVRRVRKLAEPTRIV